MVLIGMVLVWAISMAIFSIELNHLSEKLQSRSQQFQGTLELGQREKQVWVRSSLSPEQTRSVLGLPSFGVIGSRYPTSYGLRFVKEFLTCWAARVPEPVRSKILVYSGGALGIDLAVHEECLRWGIPTWAWVVGPIEKPSPRSREAVFHSLEKGGRSGLLTPSNLEPPPKGNGLAKPAKSYWLERNRWLVSSCDAIVVVEANEKSGTWSSVRIAHELGIPVYALAGPYFAPQSSGTNLMISNGYAHPIISVGKLVETLVVDTFGNPYNGYWGAKSVFK
jgi:predicted Rossmann fold nucleotide-binding protein DprA/Smf involved in DNA uptake